MSSIEDKMNTHGLVAVLQLKRRRRNNCYTLVSIRVCEGERFGMKIEAISGMTIEGIANDRAASTRWMRRMDAKLVGTSCLGIEGDAGMICFSAQYLIVGNGRLPMLLICLLPRTIQ